MGQEFCPGKWRKTLKSLTVRSESRDYFLDSKFFMLPSSLRDIMGTELTYFLPQKSVESLVLLLSK